MRRNVVFFTNSLYGGGAEKVLQTLLRSLDRQKFCITLYTLHKEAPGSAYPDDIAFRYIYGHGRAADYLRTLVYRCFSARTFYRMFVRGTYHVEVAFIEGYATRIVSGSGNPRSKKLAWVHIDLENNHWTDVAYHSRKEEEACYRKFDAVVAVSDTVRQANERLFPHCKRHLCLHNPINSEEIISKANEKTSQEMYNPLAL